MAVSINWGLFKGFLIKRALLFGVYSSAADFFKLPERGKGLCFAGKKRESCRPKLRAHALDLAALLREPIFRSSFAHAVVEAHGHPHCWR